MASPCIILRDAKRSAGNPRCFPLFLSSSSYNLLQKRILQRCLLEALKEELIFAWCVSWRSNSRDTRAIWGVRSVIRPLVGAYQSDRNTAYRSGLTSSARRVQSRALTSFSRALPPSALVFPARVFRELGRDFRVETLNDFTFRSTTT